MIISKRSKKMKKWISMCLVAVLCFTLTPVVFADSFSLRSGIHFGDTIDDVKKKENDLVFQEQSDYTSEVVLEYSGKIAGSEGKAKFYFGDDTKTLLTDVLYEFEISDKSSATALSQKIYDSCIRQYGDPTYEDGLFDLYGKAISSSYFVAAVGQEMGVLKISQDSNYEWVFLDDYDEYVTIDLVLFYKESTSSYYNSGYVIAISYHTFSDEELQGVYDNIQDEINKAQQERDDADNAF